MKFYSKFDSVSDFVIKAKQDFSIVEENCFGIISEIEESNSKFNFFNMFDKDFVLAQLNFLKSFSEEQKSSALLFGVPVSIKDCVCVKNLESRSSSKILSSYIPPYDATVISKIKENGGIILGKTVQDEFGFGTFNTNVGAGKVPLNPFDNSRSCGGSSGGSAGFSAFTSFVHVSIAESTGGSLACPSSFCGIAGLTPTYSRVSRFGLMDYASSLDKIGSMGKSVSDVALLLEVIAGFDSKDSTSSSLSVPKFSSLSSNKNFKIGVVKDLFSASSPEVASCANEFVSLLKNNGISVEEVSLPLNFEYALSAYYIIAMAEASTNLAKFSGLRFGLSDTLEGKFDDYFSKVRSAGFSEESKRRVLLGTFTRMSGYRDAFYLRALKVRTKLIEEYNSLFSKFDILVHPTMPVVAPKFFDINKLSPSQNYAMDLCTVPSNLAGLPHLSLNIGFASSVSSLSSSSSSSSSSVSFSSSSSSSSSLSSTSSALPIGMLFTASHFNESKLVEFGLFVESLISSKFFNSNNSERGVDESK